MKNIYVGVSKHKIYKLEKCFRQESAMASKLSIVERGHGQYHHHHGLLLFGDICLNNPRSIIEIKQSNQ